MDPGGPLDFVLHFAPRLSSSGRSTHLSHPRVLVVRLRILLHETRRHLTPKCECPTKFQAQIVCKQKCA